ncbi:MAG: KTSC domain-containing protein [Lutibacter sp.]
MEHYTEFSSSNVARISYDSSSSTLEVEFLNGSIYQYYGVPENVWSDFKNTGSKGQFIHQNLKGQYRYARV